MRDRKNKIETKTNESRTIQVQLQGFSSMSGKVKNKNISKRDGITVLKLIMKNTKGVQYKIRRITIDDMEGWEGWHVLNLSVENVLIYFNSSGTEHIGYNSSCVAHFFPASGTLHIRASKANHKVAGWSISRVMRYVYLKTQEPIK